MLSFLIVFVVAFLLNALPAFTPPTWMAVSYIGLKYPAFNPFGLALAGAAAATLGRLALAKMSRLLIREKLLSGATRENVDSIHGAIEGRRKLAFGLFLFYAFTPLPSNHLFIAYGLTSLGWRFITVPFFREGSSVTSFGSPRLPKPRESSKCMFPKQGPTWAPILS